jgi:thiol:disulfide interchange protein DsbC
MFKFFSLILGLITLLAPLSFSANPNEEYKSILARLIPPDISYSVTVEKNSLIKGFKQLNVAIDDSKKGMKIHKYLWVSNDKKLIVPTIIKNNNGKFERVSPKDSEKRFPVKLSWFFELIKNLPPEMKKSYGNGTEVYMFSDPYCPFCKIELAKIIKLAKDGKIKLHIIPFDVHGKKADDASAVFIKIEKEKGLLEAINKIAIASFKDVDKIVKENKKDIANLKKSYSKHLRNIENVISSNGITGTPAVVIPTKGDKGYLIVGLEDITPYTK